MMAESPKRMAERDTEKAKYPKYSRDDKYQQQLRILLCLKAPHTTNAKKTSQ